jgi:hypothetical protein
MDNLYGATDKILSLLGDGDDSDVEVEIEQDEQISESYNVEQSTSPVIETSKDSETPSTSTQTPSTSTQTPVLPSTSTETPGSTRRDYRWRKRTFSGKNISERPIYQQV